MPTPEQKKALDDGLLTKKQYDKLPSALLDGIIKSKRKKGGGKPKEVKPKKPPAKKKAPAKRRKGKKGGQTKM
tara:strand:- start:486 stop:704 length:219 start_codon:yes stop_codon:yes gene_type:complete